MHVPATGPITREECDASLRAAQPFFARHFGIECHVALCTTWLLDTQLAEYLPEDSNIIRFQRRFRLTPEIRPGDRDILKFVFRRVTTELDTLPQDTALQLAIVAHLRSGRHWHVRTGWVELDHALPGTAGQSAVSDRVPSAWTSA